MYALRETHMHSLPQKFFQFCFWNGPSAGCWLILWWPFLMLSTTLSVSSFCSFFLQVIGGVTCSWLGAVLSSVQDGIYVLRKDHTRSTPSLRSFPNIAFETVPMFIWLKMAFSRHLKDHHPALPLSMPLSSRWSMVWCPWLCAHRSCLKQCLCSAR